MKVIVILFSLFQTVNAQGKPYPYTENSLQKYSHVNFTWWGFKVYKAEVWTKKALKPDFDQEVLLHINYQRDIKAKDLLSTTLEEWQRLKLSNDRQRAVWLNNLKKIWPDIKKGDSLTTYMNGEVTSFYQGRKLLGQIKDKDFGPAFLKIWLHKKSQTSSLLNKGP